MAEPSRFMLTDQAPEVVRLPNPDGLLVDAPELGTYRDPFTGKLKRQRKRQGSEWWGTLLDRVRR